MRFKTDDGPLICPCGLGDCGRGQHIAGVCVAIWMGGHGIVVRSIHVLFFIVGSNVLVDTACARMVGVAIVAMLLEKY
eukprot:SAG31_NODE_1679_length_7544_cov_3.239758_2_plen_78_part_00